MTFQHRPRLFGAACALVVLGAVASGGIVARAAGVPTVTGVSPATGNSEGGIPVVITGTGFTGATSIQFGTTVVKTTPCPAPGPLPPPSGCFDIASDTQINAVNPGHAKAAFVDVQVTTPPPLGGISAINPSDHFAYTAPVPKAAVLSLATGTGGTLIKIAPLGGAPETSGYDFATSVNFMPVSGPGSTVAVAQSPCKVGTVSAGPSGCFTIVGDQIELRAPYVPNSDIGTVYGVTVTTAGGTSPLNPTGDQFTFIRVFDTLDGFGGLHAVTGTTPAPASPSWGWTIARGFAPLPGATNQGYILDGFGGIHPVGGAPFVGGAPYWPNWDIARAIALRADGSGYVLDGFGGLHPFGGAPQVALTGYWPGWDIARSFVLADDGVSGYVLDGFGGLHPFGGAPSVATTGYWPGWDIAHKLVLADNGVSGYVLDGFGGLHPFGGAPPAAVSGYWPGWDIARAVVLLPDLASSSSSPGGYVLDGFGGLHQFGSAPAAVATGYQPGHDVARSMGLL